MIECHVDRHRSATGTTEPTDHCCGRRGGTDLIHLYPRLLLDKPDVDIGASVDAAEVSYRAERIGHAQRGEHGYERQVRGDVELRQRELHVVRRHELLLDAREGTR